MQNTNSNKIPLSRILIIISILALTLLIAMCFFLSKSQHNSRSITEDKNTHCFAFDTLGTISGILHYGTLKIRQYQRDSWYIKLDSPICARGLEPGTYQNEIISDTVWLCLGPKQHKPDLYEKAKIFMEKEVNISGKISPAQFKDETSGRIKLLTILCDPVITIDTAKINNEKD
jgi:hypothetical protein